jgi:threonine/homoserine/homoserine lactone efflux protein
VYTLAAFAWACLLIELTPGPNMTYLAVLTVGEGRRAGLAAVAGVAIGLSIVGALAALGVGAAISSSPFLYQTLRFAGVAYLIWLAWQTWTGHDSTQTVESTVPTAQHQAMMTAFRNGVVTNLLNPKAALFYVTVLPVFIDPASPTTKQALTLAAVYVAIATAIHLTIVALAAHVRPMIAAAGKADTMRRIFGVMLLAIALWMFWATRR